MRAEALARRLSEQVAGKTMGVRAGLSLLTKVAARRTLHVRPAFRTMATRLQHQRASTPRTSVEAVLVAGRG